MCTSPQSFARRLRSEASPAEERLWANLKNSSIGFKFSRQIRIGKFFTDFSCRSRRVAIELDGRSHENREEYDNQRERAILELGYVILRFPNERVFCDLEAVLFEIQTECEARPQWRY